MGRISGNVFKMYSIPLSNAFMGREVVELHDKMYLLGIGTYYGKKVF